MFLKGAYQQGDLMAPWSPHLPLMHVLNQNKYISARTRRTILHKHVGWLAQGSCQNLAEGL